MTASTRGDRASHPKAEWRAVFKESPGAHHPSWLLFPFLSTSGKIKGSRPTHPLPRLRGANIISFCTSNSHPCEFVSIFIFSYYLWPHIIIFIILTSYFGSSASLHCHEIFFTPLLSGFFNYSLLRVRAFACAPVIYHFMTFASMNSSLLAPISHPSLPPPPSSPSLPLCPSVPVPPSFSSSSSPLPPSLLPPPTLHCSFPDSEVYNASRLSSLIFLPWFVASAFLCYEINTKNG